MRKSAVISTFVASVFAFPGCDRRRETRALDQTRQEKAPDATSTPESASSHPTLPLDPGSPLTYNEALEKLRRPAGICVSDGEWRISEYISQKGATDKEIKILSKFSNVRAVTLCEANLSSEGYRMLGGLREMEELHLHDCALTTGDLRLLLAGTRGLQKLEIANSESDLSGTASRLDDNAVDTLLSASHLKDLRLVAPAFTSEGFQRLKQIPSSLNLAVD